MGQAASTTDLIDEKWVPILEGLTRESLLDKPSKNTNRRSVYVDGDTFDLDGHVPTAMAILGRYPDVKEMRFRLVPGRMTEEEFWSRLFDLLEGQGDDEEYPEPETRDRAPPQSLPQSYESVDVVGKAPNNLPEITVVGREDPQHGSNSSLTAADELSREERHAQQVLVFQLQQSLREANNRIRSLEIELQKERNSKSRSGGEHVGEEGSCERCRNCVQPQEAPCSSTPPQKTHRGKWVMHPDCHDFLSLDDQLKDNLRREKEKRLNEVRDQMRFILDSDDLHHSFGEWDCCGQTDYNSKCT